MGLRTVIGGCLIRRFIKDLARPHGLIHCLEPAYREMAHSPRLYNGKLWVLASEPVGAARPATSAPANSAHRRR